MSADEKAGRRAGEDYAKTIAAALSGINAAEFDVLKAAAFAMSATDKRWEQEEFPGDPSVTDYAGDIIVFLQRRYGRNI